MAYATLLVDETDSGWAILNTTPDSATTLNSVKLNKDLEERKTRKRSKLWNLQRWHRQPLTKNFMQPYRNATQHHYNMITQKITFFRLCTSDEVLITYTKLHAGDMGYWSVTTNETVLIVVYRSWNCPIDLWYIVKSFFTRQCVSALNGRRYTICRYETDAGWAIISTMPGHSATYLEQANLNKDLDVRKTRKDQICDICRGGIDSHSPRTLRIHIGMQLSTTA